MDLPCDARVVRFTLAFEGICEPPGESKLLLLFDELPYMLQKIAVYGRRETRGENVALEMLDTLRAVRAKHERNLRMIFAGSVELHSMIRHHLTDD